MTKLYRSVLALLLLLPLLTSAGAFAQDPSPDLLEKFSNRADRLAEDIEADRLSDAQIEVQRSELEAIRQALVAAAQAEEAAREPLERQLDALGPAPEDGTEDVEIAGERARLTSAVEQIDARQRRAEQAAERAVALIEGLNGLRRARFEAQLFTRGPSPLNVSRASYAWRSLERQGRAVRLEIQNNIAGAREMRALIDQLALPVLMALVGLVLAIGLRRALIRRFANILAADHAMANRVMVATGITLARLLMPAVAVGLVVLAIMNSGLLGPTGQTYAWGLATGAMVVIGAFALGGAFFSPDHAQIRLSRLDDDDARRACRWMIVLAAVVGLDQVLVQAGETAGLNVDALSLLNACVLILGGVALWRYVGAAHLGQVEEQDARGQVSEPDEPGEQGQPSGSIALRILRFVTRAVAIIAPLLALAGYYGASRYLFYPVVFSGALIGVCILIHHAAREISALGSPTGAANDSEEARLPVLPVLTGSLLAILSIPLLALIWGATFTDLEAIWARMVEGFVVGEVVISPIDFVLFVIVFAIGYVLTKALQGVLRRSVLPVLRMDTGAKSALTAGIGYVGIIIAALVAISTTGLDLSNLAIVAGALSVGIGFGLQNIVNNFVSGVILLVERPIKTGDWVEIGGVHGTVQKVNVRSTEIQTFDRSTMFVPNADLISGTVTNWTHGNSNGRLIVGVGVAYGSDVRRVEKILLEVAQGHPMLMRRPGPYVIFTGFGADSLDFEIRGVLRDVNWILNVASDIRFSVYERFENEGIEIPFAQRDVHIRSLGGLEHLIGEKPKGKSEDVGSDPVPESDGPDGPG